MLSLADGIHTFIPEPRPEPLAKGSRWFIKDGQLMERLAAIVGPLQKGALQQEERPYIDVAALRQWWPVYIQLSDQGPDEFANYIGCIVQYGVRMVFFPGPCHQEHNVLPAIFRVTGHADDMRVLNWLTGPFMRGPVSMKGPGGRWRAMKLKTLGIVVEALRDVDSPERAELDKFLPKMESQLGLQEGQPGNVEHIIQLVQKLFPRRCQRRAAVVGFTVTMHRSF